MPYLDRQQEEVILRIVYDGLPFAGKTTSIQQLTLGSKREVHSPSEADGRTLFFDWLDYRAGSYQGLSLYSQVLSTPGQRALGSRREYLLSTADAAVFVLDSTRDRFAEGFAALRSCREVLETIEGPRVALVVQANKRDLPDAVPLEEICAAVEQVGGTLVLESVASEGRGVRAAFVKAVSLALDRGIRMIDDRTIPEGRPEVESAEDLLQTLYHIEGSVLDPVEEQRGRIEKVKPALTWSQRVESAMSAATQEAPVSQPVRGDLPLPHPRLPTQQIWPPVDARVLLSRVERMELPAHESWPLTFHEEPYWVVALEQHSGEFEHARARLLDWARKMGRDSQLTRNRCLALAGRQDEGAPGTWVLWEIVQTTSTLEDELRGLIVDPNPSRFARRVLALVDQLISARTEFKKGWLDVVPCIEQISSGQLAYAYPVGVRHLAACDASDGDAQGWVRRQIRPAFQGLSAENLAETPRRITALAEVVRREPRRLDAAEMISALLIDA